MSSRVRISFIVSLCGLILSTSCSDDITTVDNTRFSAEEHFSIDVARKTRTGFRLEGINGSVEVTGHSGTSSIAVSGVRRVEADSFEDAKGHLAQLVVVVDSTDTEVVVRTIEPENTGGRSYNVNYVISVPQDFVVEITNANGNVTVQSLTGGVVVQCANGRIVGNAIEGNAAMTVANGQIDASVTLLPGGQVALNTANGDIGLEIPQDTSAEFAAAVANGSIAVTNLTLSNKSQTSTSLRGTLGDGDGVISLDVANGSIMVQGF